jgi:hypothetical protein
MAAWAHGVIIPSWILDWIKVKLKRVSTEVTALCRVDGVSPGVLLLFHQLFIIALFEACSNAKSLRFFFCKEGFAAIFTFLWNFHA